MEVMQQNLKWLIFEMGTPPVNREHIHKTKRTGSSEFVKISLTVNTITRARIICLIWLKSRNKMPTNMCRNRMFKDPLLRCSTPKASPNRRRTLGAVSPQVGSKRGKAKIFKTNV